MNLYRAYIYRVWTESNYTYLLCAPAIRAESIEDAYAQAYRINPDPTHYSTVIYDYHDENEVVRRRDTGSY